MNDLIPQNEIEGEWLTMEQAAEIRGCGKTGVSKILCCYPDIKTKYTKKIGTRLFIQKEGLVVLATVQDRPRGGKTIHRTVDIEKKSKQGNEHLVVAKQKIAETAIDFMKDPIIAMRMVQLKMQEDIQELKEFKDQFLPMLEDTKPLTVTAAQRQYLNDRVRTLAIQSAVPFPVVWRGVHDQVGRRSVNDYKFEDYAVAIKYLKKTYHYYGIEW